MNKAIDFIMWLALNYPTVYRDYYQKYLKELKEKKEELKT